MIDPVGTDPSRDGGRVVAYAQWRSEEHVERMLQNPCAQPHVQRAAEIAPDDRVETNVASVGHA